MRLAKFAKSPNDRKRYTVNYDEWLDVGETITNIATSTDEVVLPEDGGFYVDGVIAGPGGRDIIMFVSGGFSGFSYDIQIEITTSGAQVKSDFITFVIKE